MRGSQHVARLGLGPFGRGLVTVRTGLRYTITYSFPMFHVVIALRPASRTTATRDGVTVNNDVRFAQGSRSHAGNP